MTEAFPNSVKNALLNAGILAMGLTGFPNFTMTEVVDALLEGQHAQLVDNVLTPTFKAVGFKKDTNQTLLELQAVLRVGGPPTPIHRNHNIELVITLLTLAFLVLRFYTRIFITRTRLRMSDCAMVVSWTLNVSLLIVQYINTAKNLTGYHVWDMTWSKQTPWPIFQRLGQCVDHRIVDKYVGSARLGNVSGLVFQLGIGAIRVSLLLFYWELSDVRRWRISLIVVGVYNIFVLLLAIFWGVFACRPVDYWNHILDPKLHCGDRVKRNLAFSSMGIAGDIMIFFMPIPIVMTLKLRTREKVVVCLMFGCGALCCVASVMRMITTDSFYKDPDMSYRQASTGIWTNIELNMLIIISCVPLLRSFAKHYWPQLLGSDRGSRKSPSGSKEGGVESGALKERAKKKEIIARAIRIKDGLTSITAGLPTIMSSSRRPSTRRPSERRPSSRRPSEFRITEEDSKAMTTVTTKSRNVDEGDLRIEEAEMVAVMKMDNREETVHIVAVEQSTATARNETLPPGTQISSDIAHIDLEKGS